jgi:hypothetical protein
MEQVQEKAAMPVQFGSAESADFEQMTWTFQMSKGFKVAAGEFAILPIRTMEELMSALQGLVEEKADYMRLNNLGDPEQTHTIKHARSVMAAANGR